MERVVIARYRVRIEVDAVCVTCGVSVEDPFALPDGSHRVEWTGEAEGRLTRVFACAACGASEVIIRARCLVEGSG